MGWCAVQRSQREDFASRLWLRLVWPLWAALALGTACGDDTASPSGARAADASRPMPDAALQPSDAGNPGAARAPRGQIFASARVSLAALPDDAADGGGIPVVGQAQFRQTSEGVNLEIELRSCTGETSYSLAILEAQDCSSASLRAADWGGGRGVGLPVLLCPGTGVAQAATGYARANNTKGAWTIGDGSASDMLGRAFVVRAETTPVACGVITRAEDREHLELPPDDQPPSLATRAAIGGICLGRQFPGSSPGCPDDTALLRCEARHCDIGSCLQTCAAYASCLDRENTQCSFSSQCEASAECLKCQDELQHCSMMFCAEHGWCPAAPSADGPCQRLAHCCALQGRDDEFCQGVIVPLLSGLGGDANCVASMLDLGVLPLLHVPCTYGAIELPMDAGANTSTMAPETGPPLADQHAGIACARDEDCPGGKCAPGPEDTAATSGFCTRSCQVTYECGAEAVCSGSEGAKRCFHACRDQSDCRAGFVCSGGSQGSRISLPGACRPKRQADQLEDGVAGGACASNAECSGGQCATEDLLGTTYPGNYCTARCYEDAQCGEGGVCLWTHTSSDPGYCLRACQSDAECTREDYGCWELSDGTRPLHACYPRKRPLPDRRTGSPCTSDSDCGAPHASCAKKLPYYGLTTNDTTDAPGGYCTQACALDIECGAGAQCINYGTSGGLCFATCSTDNPCREGYACQAHGRDNDTTASVCVASEP